jgi:dTDP-4-dehydrorhamnose 3,5-epimerase-like enzyme
MNMTNDEYTSAVDRGEWPSDPRVPLDDPFTNHNGTIQNLVLKNMTSVAALTSVKGAVRANHYHKTDWHYAYVVSGSVAYFERPIGSDFIPEPTVFRKGEMFFTPPMKEHTMVFLADDSVIITMARNVRSHDSHEADLERVTFITPELAKSIVERFG